MILSLLFSLGGPLGWGLLGAWAQAPSTRLSDLQSSRLPGVWRAEAEDTDRDPVGRNWCPYPMSKLVTLLAVCKTEKFLVHSQQPCPQGAPDCQRVKVMYRMAHKPVYQVKQKVLTSLAWRCCPGYTGPNCEHHDSMAIPEPADPGDSHQEPGDGPINFQPEFPDGSLEQVLLPHMDTFLHVHFSPIWRSFNESLHSLAQAIRNLSLDVEANRQAISRVQDSAMVRADFQELGAKFEAKVQENAQRVSQLQQDMEDRLHAQHLTLHHSVSELQVDVDTKLKRLHKAQEARGTNGSLVVATPWAGAKPEPESLQARLGQLQRNLSELHMTTALREKEFQNTLEDMRATLTQHGDEIKELYSESDETFDQINKVERQVEELQVNHTALRELRVILMEKSLIMEENKEEVERQLLELNLTLQHLQGGHADLIKYVKDCNCHKLYLDLDIIREGQRGATHALEETQVSLDEQRQLDGPSLQALQSTVDAVSLAMDTHKAEGERARAATARLRSQVQALDDEMGALKAAAAETRHEVRQLHSAFAALLEDALRHEAVLAALFGEEVMEEMSEEAPGPLPLSYEQIRVALQDAAIGLQEQALGWDVLAARVAALEQALELPRPVERLEPSHDLGREEAATTTLAGLARELQSLSREVQRVAGCCEATAEAGAVSFNASLDGLHSTLSATRRSLEQHQQLFHSLFGNFQGLMAANVSLDLGKLQTILSRKEKKQQKGLEAPRKRDKKEAEPLVDGRITGPVPGALGTALWEAGSPVAFYASFSGGTAALQMVKFNTTYINVGSSYFPEHGYFRAPEHGVYLFAASIEFGPGPGTGQLVFGGHHRTPVHTTGHGGGSTATVFAMAELQKGERVWFELTQGSITKRSLPGTVFGGFLIFKT
uniref:Multimerin-2 n=1 Tax=Callithrix jacchus TaxID=9483 RepID=A0A5F4VV15_CALJA